MQLHPVPRLIALWLACTSFAGAQTIYDQGFDNKTGRDQPLSSIRWQAHVGEETTNAGIGQANVQAGGRIYTSLTQGNPLALTTAGLRLDPPSGAAISFDMSQSGNIGRVQLLIQLDEGRWVVSKQVWTPLKGPLQEGTRVNVAFTRDAKAWLAFKLEPGVAMGMGEPLTDSLGAQVVTGVGFWLTNVDPQYGVVIRLDNLRIETGKIASMMPLGAAPPAASADGSNAVKLLTIGNSFADNATAYLPEMARLAGRPLVLFRANLGGHSLQQHAQYLEAFEADPSDPKGRPYKNKTDPKTGEKKDFSLPEVLAAADWNFVTIQQLSNLSYREDSYEPWAGILVAAIRKYAPHAEILVHQTWAYREDYPPFSKSDSFTQQKMFEELKGAYAKLAGRYGLRIIPVGEAFQEARRLPRWTFTFPDSDFDYRNPPARAVPRQPGSLNAGWMWQKNKQTGKPVFTLDFKHANNEGRYLGAAMFFETLLGSDIRAVNFTPKGMTEEDAKELRRIAHEAGASQPKIASRQREPTSTR